MPMPKKKSKFLGDDKCNWQTFSLVARSRKDLHEGDATTGQNVLVAMDTLGDGEEIPDSDAAAGFRVYYDDDYDYMQHIRTLDEFYDNTMVKAPTTTVKCRKIRLPAAVFADEPVNDNNDLDIDLDNEVLDPEVEAALADDAEIDDELEDDFVAMATRPLPGESEERLRNFQASKSAVWARFFDQEGSGEDSGSDEEGEIKKSMTVRTKGGRQLTESELLLEKQFEKLYEEFTKDGEELEAGTRMSGTTGVSESLAYLVSRDQAMFAADNAQPGVSSEDAEGNEEEVSLKRKTLALISEDGSEDADVDDDPVEAWARMDRRKKIDCDVTSVRSSVVPENIPRLMQIPGDPKPARSRLTSSKTGEGTQRPPSPSPPAAAAPLFIAGREAGETSDEKRARKKAVKEAHRLRRCEKKINRAAFQAASIEPVVVKAMKLT